MLWANRTGVIPGSGGYFLPENTITREQAAAILYRYAAMRSRDVSVQGDLKAWNDASAVSGENVTAVTWALEKGLLTGFADGTLRPGQTITCGEAVSMIRTMQQKL